MRLKMVVLALMLSVGLSACGKEGGGGSKLELQATDQMTYNLKKLEAKAGAKVTLVLKHVGTMKVEAMGHNVVIVQPGTDIAKFAAAATAAGAGAGYIPPSFKDKIIAHTKLVGGGESTEISFTAPAAGTYPFFCSFPGHYAIMKGELIVK